MDIYRELGPKVRPGIEGPYRPKKRFNLKEALIIVLTGGTFFLIFMGMIRGIGGM